MKNIVLYEVKKLLKAKSAVILCILLAVFNIVISFFGVPADNVTAQKKYDKVGIVSTKYISVMSQEPCVRWILPLSEPETAKSLGVIFEPDERTILDAALPEYITGIIVSAVRESFCSEVAARKTAMDSAGKNAEEMIAELGIQYNRARQGAITQEITEIIAGSGT